ncbi:MAG: class I SAM-dependent methyltransferase [Planctomycetota bacterium]
MSESKQRGSEWFRRAFEKVYLDLYAHRTDEAASQEVDKISTWTKVDAALSAPVLDLGCGNGRHAAAWSRKQLSVLGLDLSNDLIQEARARRLANVLFLEGDMRHLSFDSYFQLVTSLFTSFGYFEDDAEDLTVVVGVAKSLLPGGSFVLDFLNADYVRHHLVERSEERKKDLVVYQQRRITADGKRVEKTITMIRDDGWQREHRESVRLYNEQDLQEMMEEAGLVLDQRYGDFGGKPITPQSSRVILVAKKPEIRV